MSWRQSHRLETHSEATLQTASSFQLPLDTEAVSTRLGGQHSCRAGRNRADAEPRGSNLWDVSQALQCCTHLYIALVCLSPEVFGFTMHGPCLAFSTGPWGSNQSSTAPGPVKEVNLKVARWRPSRVATRIQAILIFHKSSRWRSSTPIITWRTRCEDLGMSWYISCSRLS